MSKMQKISYKNVNLNHYDMTGFCNKLSYYAAYIIAYEVFLCAISMFCYLFFPAETIPAGKDLVSSIVIYVITQFLIARKNCRLGFIIPVILATLGYVMIGDINGEDIPFNTLYVLAPPLLLIIEQIRNFVSNPIWLFHATYMIATIGLMFYLYGIHVLFHTFFDRCVAYLIIRKRYFRIWVCYHRKRMRSISQLRPRIVLRYPFALFLAILIVIKSSDIFHYIRKVVLLGTSHQVITATLVDIPKRGLHSYGVFQYEWDGKSYTSTSSFPDDMLLGLKNGDKIDIYISTTHPEYMDVEYWYHF